MTRILLSNEERRDPAATLEGTQNITPAPNDVSEIHWLHGYMRQQTAQIGLLRRTRSASEDTRDSSTGECK
eukprot:scaffold695_cov279-Chaetoceros_neogracile.AAC.38